jgi:hypothetical protein
MRSWPVVLALAPLAGCGPTQAEMGQAILIAAPLITIAGIGLQALYALLWRRLGADVHLRWQIQGPLLAFLVLGALLPALRWQRRTDDWIFAALVFAGSSYLSLLLVTMRILVITSLRRWFAWAGAMVWVLLWLPAFHHALWGSTTNEDSIFVIVWLLPGYMGLITFLLLLGFGVELAIRLAIAARRRRAAEQPPLPEARIHRG